MCVFGGSDVNMVWGGGRGTTNTTPTAQLAGGAAAQGSGG